MNVWSEIQAVDKWCGTLIGAKRKHVGKILTVGPSVIICVVNAKTHNTIMLRGVKMFFFRPAHKKFSSMKALTFT